jgi:hypothetical protein
MPLINNM